MRVDDHRSHLVVGEVIHLEHEHLAVVVRGEADPVGDGALEGVHADALVPAAEDALLAVHEQEGPGDGGVLVGREPHLPRGLHTSADDV